MIGQAKHQGRLRPERNIDKIIFVGNVRGPVVDGVGDQEMEHIWMREDYVGHKAINKSAEIAQHGIPEVLEVEISVEIQGKRIGDGGETDVQTRVASSREEIQLGVVGVAQAAVKKLEVDEGDGEAL